MPSSAESGSVAHLIKEAPAEAEEEVFVPRGVPEGKPFRKFLCILRQGG